MGNTKLNLPKITLHHLILFLLVVGLAKEVWPKDQNFIVAVEVTAPCVMHADSGYTGFDIELWEAIARDLDLAFTYHETDLKGIFSDVASEKADVAFQLLMQVRNKIIAAYETIMRMQA